MTGFTVTQTEDKAPNFPFKKCLNCKQFVVRSSEGKQTDNMRVNADDTRNISTETKGYKRRQN